MNANDPVYPLHSAWHEGQEQVCGMSIRVAIAKGIMESLVAGMKVADAEHLAKVAVNYTDSLISQLNKTP